MGKGSFDGHRSFGPTGGNGGGANLPWKLNITNVWASPQGSDSNDGLSPQQPKKFGYSAAEVLIAAATDGGTGQLNLVDGVAWGGPVANQGMWFRGDGLNVPGFLPKVSMVIQGLGRQAAASFGRPATAIFNGPINGDRFKPAVMMVGGGAAKPIDMYNIRTPGFLWVPYKVGMDFERKGDGSLNNIAIANATRSGFQTTLTVTLPTGKALVDAKRVSNAVTVRLAWPGGFYYAPNIGTRIRVVTADANFPSIDTIVTGCVSDTTHSPDGVAITYPQAGADIAYTAVTNGTLTSNNCQAQDIIEGVFTSAEWPSTMYRVLSVPAVDVIIISDVYGYAPRNPAANVNNPGTYVRQERGRLWYNGDQWTNCTGQIQQGSATEIFGVGPYIDAGASTAEPLNLRGCQLYGYQWANHNGAFSDKDRGAALLLDGGIQTAIVAADARDMTIAGGGVRAYSSQDGIRVFVSNWLQEGIDGFSPPGVEIVTGDNNSTGELNEVVLADTDGTVPNVKIASTIPIGNFRIRNTPTPITGPALVDFQSEIPNDTSPWPRRQWGTWTKGSSTPHIGPMRQFGPVTTRWQNLVLPVTGWNGGAPPAYTAVDGPGGQSNLAVQFAPVGFTEIPIVTDPQTGLAAGDRIAAGVWVNFQGGNEGVGIFYGGSSNPGLVLDNGLAVSTITDFAQSPGWQWVWVANTVVNPGNGNWKALLRFTIPGTTQFYAPTVIKIPAAFTDNDVWEAIGNMKHQALNLRPGETGTMEGERFYAQGGLGGPFDPVALVAPYYDPVTGNLVGYFPLAPNPSRSSPSFITATIDCKVVGNHVIVPRLAGKSWRTDNARMRVVTNTGLATAATINMGSNGGAYNNIVNGFAIGGASPADATYLFNGSFSWPTASVNTDDVNIRVDTGATGTALQVQFMVWGEYV